MAHYIKYSKYPNNEIRVIHYYQAPKKEPKIRVSAPVPVLPSAALLPAGEANQIPLTLAPNSKPTNEKKPGYGKMGKRTTFGANARHTILRIGGALDVHDNTRKNYVFLTGTLPGSTPQAYAAICEYSSFAVQRLTAWLGKHVKSKLSFYVWELQKRGALHLHYCIHIPEKKARDYVLQNFKAQWTRILDAITELSSCDLWMRHDGTHHRKGKSVLQAYSQCVRKSVAAYMAGYCSNGKDKHVSDASSPYYPVRWWGASRPALALMRSMTEEVLEEHPTYLQARARMNWWENTISVDTRKKYRYNHKVGVGETIVSYHPHDKASEQWQHLKPMKYNSHLYPNAYSLIAATLEAWKVSPTLLRLSQGSKIKSYGSLLRDLEDSHLLDSLSRRTLSNRHIRIMLSTASVLKPALLESQAQNIFVNTWVPAIWLLNKTLSEIRLNKDGWMCNDQDLSIRLTDCWAVCDSRTKSQNDGSTTGEPENSPYLQLSLLN